MSSATQPDFVSTRYLGSKRKLVHWILKQTRAIRFDTLLDAFGGTGSVGYAFKRMGKSVTYNDLLTSSYQTGVALIENSEFKLSDADIDWITTKHRGQQYPTFIRRTFRGIYYKDYENAWLDVAVTNIDHLKNRYKKALALHALCQACLVKRPFNLFHRRNLYLRLAKVERGFSNYVTWERPFGECFRQFALEANNHVCDNKKSNIALNLDVFDVPDRNFDVVYIDTPHLSKHWHEPIDYFNMYHFLEGLCDYENWRDRLDHQSKNKHLEPNGHSWGTQRENLEQDFDRLFKKFQESKLIVSYRSQGDPSIGVLKTLLEQYKRTVKISTKSYKYVLSRPQRWLACRRSNNREVLLIAN
jgi:adenine-specific DNA methylase